MFTGIIQSVGAIRSITSKGGDVRLEIEVAGLTMGDVTIGDSIATQGVCLTAIGFDDRAFSADVSNETLSRTTLGGLGIGAPVNLEKALTPSTPLGGHIVSGHVDGVGQVLSRQDDGRSVRFSIEAPHELARYIAAKGSICVDGISLTVNAVDGAVFELNIVPHTLKETTIGGYVVGTRVNLEVDIIARHLERLMLGERAAEPGAVLEGGVTLDLLKTHGFA